MEFESVLLDNRVNRLSPSALLRTRLACASACQVSTHVSVDTRARMTAADISELLPLARVMEGRDGRSEASLDFLSKPGVASHGTDDLDNISLKRSDDDETEPC